MGVESVQPRRGPWTDVRAHCRRRQADARGRVGSVKVSPRAPRVLASTSLSRPRSSGLAGLEYQPAHQRTYNKLRPWLACNSKSSKTYQDSAPEKAGCSEVRSCCYTAPLCLSPTPRARISRRRSIRFAKCRMHVSILMPQTSQDEALFLGSHALSTRTGTRSKAGHTKATPGTQLRGGQRKREGIPTPINSCRQAGRSGRDGVMLQGAPVSTDLVGLSDRAGSEAATSDHQTEPTSRVHTPMPTPQVGWHFQAYGGGPSLPFGPSFCCVSGWLQDLVGRHKHIFHCSSALTTWLRADRGGFQAPTPPVRQMKAI